MRKIIVFLKETEEKRRWIFQMEENGGELCLVKEWKEWEEECGKKTEYGRVFLTDSAKAAEKAKEWSLSVVYYETPGAVSVWRADLTILSLKGMNWQEFEKVWRRHQRLPWIVAQTERLSIRESIAEDFEKIYGIGQQEKENPYLLQMEERKDREYEKFTAYIREQYSFYGYGLYTLEERKNHRIIGRAGFGQRTYKGESYLELGYLIRKEERRKGYALEAGMALAENMEVLTGERVAYIFCHPDNVASIRTAQALKNVYPDRFSLIFTRMVW